MPTILGSRRSKDIEISSRKYQRIEDLGDERYTLCTAVPMYRPYQDEFRRSVRKITEDVEDVESHDCCCSVMRRRLHSTMAAAGGRESRIGHLTWTLSSRREYVDDGLREGDRSPPRGQLESFGVDVTVLFFAMLVMALMASSRPT